VTNRSYVVDVVERLANTAATLGEISRSEDSEHRIVLADFSAEAGGVALLAQTDRLDEMLVPLDGRLICRNDHSRHFNVESLVDLRRPNEVEDRHRDQDHRYQAAQYDAYPFEYSFIPSSPSRQPTRTRALPMFPVRARQISRPLSSDLTGRTFLVAKEVLG
jgi:hypothetical protein